MFCKHTKPYFDCHSLSEGHQQWQEIYLREKKGVLRKKINMNIFKTNSRDNNNNSNNNNNSKNNNSSNNNNNNDTKIDNIETHNKCNSKYLLIPLVFVGSVILKLKSSPPCFFAFLYPPTYLIQPPRNLAFLRLYTITVTKVNQDQMYRFSLIWPEHCSYSRKVIFSDGI